MVRKELIRSLMSVEEELLSMDLDMVILEREMGTYMSQLRD